MTRKTLPRPFPLLIKQVHTYKTIPFQEPNQTSYPLYSKKRVALILEHYDFRNQTVSRIHKTFFLIKVSAENPTIDHSPQQPGCAFMGLGGEGVIALTLALIRSSTIGVAFPSLYSSQGS